MTAFSDTVLHIVRTGYKQLVRRAAPDQGGLFSGKDPTEVNTADPLRIWIVQLGVIMVTTQILSMLLRKMHQPRVIAEVIGGILLGPTAFGRIPGFTQHVFPKESIPFLSLVANIGLVLFLFIIGLEIERSVITRNARVSATISLGGMVLPFALGTGLSTAIYKEFVDPSIKFTHFMLFVGVAFSITAFPVLCRILTELKILDTTVGIVVLSAGVGNDLVGWTLLALSVALVNAASGLTAVWILLTCVGWALFIIFPMRRAIHWLAHRTGSIENGQPTMFFMTAVMILVFGSAFFTDVIGVHAIFGGFLAGLTVPREKGLAIAIVEKLEDMVSIIFLPLYFTLSGLSTNLGLLNNGITWGYTIGIITLAYIGKFGGCTIAARIAGFNWREAATAGTLMSCKGLVELIVLNVGLAAGILDTRVFSMFVLEALVLTFMTTPVVVALYPPELRKRAVAVGDNFGGVQEGGTEKDGGSADTPDIDQDGWKTRFTVVLDKMEHLPGIMVVAQLFRPFAPEVEVLKTRGSSDQRSPSISSTERMAPTSSIIDALRLIELSDRTSDVMKSSVTDTLIRTDPVLNVFRTFSDLNDVPVTTTLSVVPFDGLATKVAEHARENLSHLVLVPWLPHTVPITHAPGHHSVGTEHNTHTHPPGTPAAGAGSTNPFDVFLNFGSAEQSSSAMHAHFVRGIFSQSTVDVALFVDRGRAGLGHFSKQHIIMPFYGGPDDRLALALVVQLCANPMTTAKIIRMTKLDAPSEEPAKPDEAHTTDHLKYSEALATAMRENGLTVNSVPGNPDTVYGNATTQTRLQSATADNIAWQSYTSPTASLPLSAGIRKALTRVEFVQIETTTPLRDSLNHAATETDVAVKRKARPFVFVGRARRLAVESHHAELREILEERGHVLSEVRKTMGDVATAFVVSGMTAGLVVVQSAGEER